MASSYGDAAGKRSSPRPDDAQPARGCRTIAPADEHMWPAGYRDPPPMRHGRENRTYHEENRAGQQWRQQDDSARGQGRKAFEVRDHMNNTFVAHPVRRVDEAEDVKDAIRVSLKEDYGVEVTNEERWAKAAVFRHGCHWKFEALTDQSVALSREARTPQQIAQKLSMSPVHDMRVFGLLPGGQPAPPRGEQSRRQQDQPPASNARKVKGAPYQDNPSFVSPGLHDAMGGDSSAWPQGSYEFSRSRRDPMEMSRRYIPDNKDHFRAMGVIDTNKIGERAEGRRSVPKVYQDNLFGPNHKA